MSTLIDAILPTEKDLEDALFSVIESQEDQVLYVEKTLENLVTILNRRPEQFKSYGPWWPAIKTLLINHGYGDFGQVVNSDVAQIFSYSRESLTLVAGILYSSERLESYLVSDAYHSLSVRPEADDTEPYLYISEDESLEKYHLQ